MAGFRITGVVRAARRAHERLRSGVPAAEREDFLAGLKRTVRDVEALCAEGGVTPSDLPAPSRRALSDLRRLAALAPDALPMPGAEPASRRLTISNVVATLDRTLDELTDLQGDPLRALDEDAGEEDFGVTLALSGARRCVAAVERICDEEGVTPAALPERTGQAYASLRWLVDEENLARYLEQRDAVCGALLRAIHDPGGRRPAWRDLVPRVSFRPGTTVARIRRRDGVLDCRLNLGWLGATDDQLAAYAEVVVRRDGASPAARDVVRSFLDSEVYGALHLELGAIRDARGDEPRGRVRDLEVLFERLDARFFRGVLPRPRLAWYAGASVSCFGLYIPSRDQVRIDVRLDDEAVPEFVTEFVLYHELLHKVHGAEMRGRRRHVHTPAFRADEQRYPRADEAEWWLSKLARASSGRPDRDAPAPPPAPRQTVLEPGTGPLTPPLRTAKVPRNAPCPCGSGRKHKRCCLR